jgi:hypothetical protein
MPLRTLIAGKLEKSGVLPLQTAKIRGFIPACTTSPCPRV